VDPPRDSSPLLADEIGPLPADVTPAAAPVAVTTDGGPAISPAARVVLFGIGGLALLLLAAAGAPASVLRTVSGGLVWRRSDLAFAALVLLGVGLLAALVAGT
jgi:hypothetical protein